MKIVRILVVFVTMSLFYSTSVLSVERPASLYSDYDLYKGYESGVQKDQCLVMAKNCAGSYDNVYKRVERLNREIEKGAAVYTPEELQNFRDQLNWIYYESGDFPAFQM